VTVALVLSVHFAFQSAEWCGNHVLEGGESLKLVLSLKNANDDSSADASLWAGEACDPGQDAIRGIAVLMSVLKLSPALRLTDRLIFCTNVYAFSPLSARRLHRLPTTQRVCTQLSDPPGVRVPGARADGASGHKLRPMPPRHLFHRQDYIIHMQCA